MHPSSPRFNLPMGWLTLLLAVMLSACATLPTYPRRAAGDSGPVVPQRATIFDRHWNSTVVYPLATVVVHSDPAASLRSAFDTATTSANTLPPAPLDETDLSGDPPLGEQLRTGRLHSIRAEANAVADSPTKALGDDPLATESLAQLTMGFFAQAQSEINIVSPCVPGDLGVARVQAMRERGIKITVVTNSLADSAEPHINIPYNRCRVALLRAGVDLHEVSTRQLKRSGNFRRLLKQARCQLHANLALIDREWVLLGSMNLDPRSTRLNAELGVRVHSRQLRHALVYGHNLDDIEGVYKVRLKAKGENVQWVGTGDVENEVLDDEPDSSMLTWLQLVLFSWFVPIDQL